MLFRRQHHVSEADLSSLLDGQLSSAAQQRCDAHLAACGGCQEALDGLRAVRSSLRDLPWAEAPRSFRLREAQVELIRSRQPAFIVRVMPQLTGISVVSLVAFLALVGVNAFGSFETNSSDTAEVQSLAADQESVAASESPPDALESSGASPGTTSAPEVERAAGSTYDATGGDDAAFSAEATREAIAQLAPDPASEGEDGDDTVSSATNTSDDSSTGLYIAMAVTAVLALVSGGLAFAAWRRT